MPQENYYAIYESYESDVKGKDIFKEENEAYYSDMLPEEEETVLQPSTKERVREAANMAGLDEYEVDTQGDVKDGESGVCVKISGHFSAAELRWLLSKVEETNMSVYGATSDGQFEEADPAL